MKRSSDEEKNIPLGIAFLIAMISGPAAFCIVLSSELPAYITIPVLVYIASSIAAWWFSQKHSK